MSWISTLPLLYLILSTFIFIFFNEYLGPKGVFYTSLINYTIFIILGFKSLILILQTGYFYYYDLGQWFFCLNLIDSNLILCLDSLSLILVILVSFLSSFAIYFGTEYMNKDFFISRLLYLLILFSLSVMLLFVAYDFFLILISWELLGLFSFLLVNFYLTRVYTFKAALKTFFFSRLSDFFLFYSFVIILFFFKTSDLSLIFLQSPFLTYYFFNYGVIKLHVLSILTLFLSLAGLIKSAQFFFHVWLPDAMEAPTPASALIHSSTLVVAGVYLVLRFELLFEFTGSTNYFLAFWGSLTLSFASVIALFQIDIKKLIAYSTISQIGYLYSGLGFLATNEVLLYLIIHAINKAFLFMLAGYLVFFFNHNTDLRFMGGIYLYNFEFSILLLIIALNLSGLPYSSGFFSKEFLIYQIFNNSFESRTLKGFWLVSFLCTPVYLLKVLVNSIFTLKKAESFRFSTLLFKFNRLKIFRKNIRINTQTPLLNSLLSSLLFFTLLLILTFGGESYIYLLNSFSPNINFIGHNNYFNYDINKFLSLTLLTNSFSTHLNFFISFLALHALFFVSNLSIKNTKNFTFLPILLVILAYILLLFCF